MENKMAEAFKKLIDVLADRAPEVIDFNNQPMPNTGKAFMCQVSLANGAVMAGALSKTSVEGLYSLRAMVRRGDARSGPIDVVDQFFTADAIVQLTVPIEKKTRSGLVGPGGDEVVSPFTDV